MEKDVWVGKYKTGDWEKEDTLMRDPTEAYADEEKQEVQKLLRKYSDVFAKDEFDLGYTGVIKYRIALTDDTPICKKSREEIFGVGNYRYSNKP